MKKPASSTCIIAVLLPDRVGILRDVTAVIFECGGNIEGIRQTLVEGFFSLVLVAKFSATVTPESLQKNLAGRLEPGASVVVQPHTPQPPPLPSGIRYVVMTRGPDRPGTIHDISSFFVERGINIEDWQVDTEGGDVIYTAQVALPEKLDFIGVRTDFHACMAKRGLSATICHENIFRATNEVGPIKNLLRATRAGDPTCSPDKMC
jgi:predicted amino acid-binding ACT domain protein